jgi:hypothetical protein
VQSPAFIKADTSVNISASSTDLSTGHAEEDPEKVLSKQKHVVFGSEGPLRKKALHI